MVCKPRTSAALPTMTLKLTAEAVSFHIVLLSAMFPVAVQQGELRQERRIRERERVCVSEAIRLGMLRRAVTDHRLTWVHVLQLKVDGENTCTPEQRLVTPKRTRNQD